MIRAAAAVLACISAAASAAGFDARPIALQAAPGVVTLDYFAWDGARGRLWVPGGNTGSVFVIDRGGAVKAIGGFETAEFTLGSRHGRLGASSVAIGDGVAYVGDRADRSVCAVDAATLARLGCLAIATPEEGWAGAPDAVVYVAATKELWITRGAPPIGIPSADKALTVIDVSNPRAPRIAAKIPIGASAEGFAVDATRGLFYTNLEETGETIALDVRTRAIVARWKPGCDEARGLALDEERGFLFAACSGRVVAIDVKDDGRTLGAIDTGGGLDNIDYSPASRRLYAAASQAATLTIAFVTPWGRLESIAVVPTAKGARGVVAGDGDTAYVADPLGGRILVVSPR